MASLRTRVASTAREYALRGITSKSRHTRRWLLLRSRTGQIDPWDLNSHDEHLTLLQLRELGEIIQRQHPGTQDMGQSASTQARKGLRKVNWIRVRQSCAPLHNPAAKRVLVTGTGGFVGMHTAIALRRRGDGVVGLDNFNDYYPVSIKRARQANAETAGVYTVDGDLNDAALLRQLFDECPFTHVLHLAAQAGVRYATINPYSYVHANLGGQVTLLEVVKDREPRPAVVYASSSSVYGLNTKQPFGEEDRVDVPASLYAATKRADELIAHVYFNIHKISLTGLRFFTVYGPWGRPDMAAYKFAVAIMKEEPINIFQGPGGEELRRDFTYIDDIVAGVVGAVDAIPPSGKGSAHNKVYNLGNTQPHTVTELVDVLERALGRLALKKVVPVPPTGDVLATFANVSAASTAFAYKPSVPLEEGLQRFVMWFTEFYGPQVVAGKVVPRDWAYNPL